jgi:ribosomal protein S18 acetylase RimI-like enzyme
MAQREEVRIPERVGDPAEIDYSAAPPDFGPLARDRIPVRSMREADLRILSAIDERITGRDRRPYFERKLAEALQESDVRVSLVAEIEGQPVGFIMARVDLGEFGRLESAAVLDTIGIDPEFRGRGVGRALLTQLLVNLSSLRVDKIQTEVDWSDGDLMGFLARCGFRPSARLSFACRVT